MCFVDADTRIHGETFRAIDDALAGGRVVGGATGVRLERWSPGMERDHRFVAIFPTPKDKGVMIEPARFAEDLKKGLSRYG